MWLVTAACLSLLGNDEYAVRDTAERVLLFSADRGTAKVAARTSECPEVRAIASRVHRRLTIRDMDFLFSGSYPSSNVVNYPRHWPNALFFGVGDYTTDVGWPEEFINLMDVYSTSDESPTVLRSHEDYTERTRTALITYVLRTGDWYTAWRITQCPR